MILENVIVNGFYFMLQVKKVVVQEGFERQKRGYRDINDFDISLNDPLFSKQWYLVSDYNMYCIHVFMHDLQNHSCSWQINQNGCYFLFISFFSLAVSVSHNPRASIFNTPSLFLRDFIFYGNFVCFMKTECHLY